MSETVQPGHGHLLWSELACHDASRTAYPEDYRTDPTRLPALCAAFEAIRQECSLEVGMSCPVIVTSGYRTKAYQTALQQNPGYKAADAKTSQHVQGRALDLACPRLLTFAQFQACVERAACHANSPIRYLEYRPSHHYIHVDVRPTKTLVEETIP